MAFDTRRALVLWLGVAGCAALAAACAANEPLPRGAVLSPSMQRTLGHSAPVCSAPAARLGRDYLVFDAIGMLQRGRFTAASTSRWVQVELVKPTPIPTGTPSAAPSATPTAGPTASPTPKPTAKPTPTPKPQPAYEYYGEFARPHGTGGCLYLLTTQNGKPVPGTSFGAVAIAQPHLKRRAAFAPTSSKGTIQLTIGPLSRTGGRGTFTLKLDSGAAYGTGTVRLTGRIVTSL